MTVTNVLSPLIASLPSSLNILPNNQLTNFSSASCSPRVARINHSSLLHNLHHHPLLSHAHPRNQCTLSPSPTDFFQINQFRKGDRSAYAIITGPTSGIGKSFSFALAKSRFNLILISRSLSKLQSLQTGINTKFPDVDIRLVDVDLGVVPLGAKFGDMLKKVSETGDIRILVNNAGMSHDMPVTFEDMTTEEMEGIVGVNTCRVTKETFPYLLNNRYHPLIFNVNV